jgi:uncharacterized protein YbjT (DUF2867 family)
MEAFLDRYCHDLPCRPLKNYKVLVTGATGYIGGELIPELVARGYDVKIMVRSLKQEYKKRWPSVEVCVADALNYQHLQDALAGVQSAYYLIHSFNNKDRFQKMDLKAARNFRAAADANNVKRIIYLGGLGDKEKDLSNHLRSRIKVAESLSEGKSSVTFLRAAVIIGSGSSSYQIMKSIVSNCPIFVFPSWAKSKCQPISIRDAIKYLVACLEIKETAGNTYDIGGPDVHTYAEMLELQAKSLGKKRLFIQSSFSSVNIYAKIASVVTPKSKALISVLFESCKNNVICHNTTIREIIPIKLIGYGEALERAISRASQQSLFRRKQESLSGDINSSIQQEIEPPLRTSGFFGDVRSFMFHKAKVPTLINFKSHIDREDYSLRILQRLGTEVSKYKILNVHKIGVNAPAKYIFDELLEWNGDSTCWPNHLAKIVKDNDRLENLNVFLFGWDRLPNWFKNSFIGRTFVPLFTLDALQFQKIPDPSAADNARFLLYKSSGGYPIGIFSLYVRSSIAHLQETEQSQLFLVVGFNFYGKKSWSNRISLNRVWESVHDRVTSNILNRLKQLSEWRFAKMKTGDQ